MKRRLVLPVLNAMALAAACAMVTVSLGGCRAHAQVAVQAKAPAPAPAPPPPPPPEPPKPAPIVDNKIVLPGELEFEVNSAKIRETDASLSILSQLAQIMKDNPKITRLRIEGHTDSSGRPKKNLKLSKDRADAVARWLTQHDVAEARLAAVGLGDTRPLMDNDTPEHRAMNRRTEFHLEVVDGKPVADDAAPQTVASR